MYINLYIFVIKMKPRLKNLYLFTVSLNVINNFINTKKKKKKKNTYTLWALCLWCGPFYVLFYTVTIIVGNNIGLSIASVFPLENIRLTDIAITRWLQLWKAINQDPENLLISSHKIKSLYIAFVWIIIFLLLTRL